MESRHRERKRSRDHGARRESCGIAKRLHDRSKQKRAGGEPEEQDGAVHPHRDAARRGGGQVGKHHTHGDECRGHEGRTDAEHDRRPDESGEVPEHGTRTGPGDHADKNDGPAVARAIYEPTAGDSRDAVDDSLQREQIANLGAGESERFLPEDRQEGPSVAATRPMVTGKNER